MNVGTSRHVCLRTTLAGVALSAVLAGTASQAQIRSRLSAVEIDEAIQAGIAGNVAPFHMYPAGGDLGKRALAADRPGPVVVYTPFVRVALHARAASERGTTILRTEVPAACCSC